MRKRLFPALLALLLLCTACTPTPADEPNQGAYTLYFVSAENRQDGAALTTEGRDLPPDGSEVRGLLELLFSGPESAALRSPFPAGTSLRGVSVEEGTAYVDLSEAYGGLSGVDLTLADGCVVLTLCQLEGVEAVYLTVEGRPRPFRDQVLTPADFLLDNTIPVGGDDPGAPSDDAGEPAEDGEDTDAPEPTESPEP